MELFDALGDAVVRTLAAKRASVPRFMLVGSDAAVRMAQALRDETTGRNAAVIFDQRTRAAAGDAVIQALAGCGFVVHTRLVADREGHGPVCDDRTRDALGAALPDFDVLVGVGSGVISDLAKWVAFDRARPAAIFATAASMNGYAAANVAPAIGGVKTLFHARAHRVVAADPAVLAAAPPELTSAGLGDVIAKTVSTADWKMNEILFGESFDAAVAGIIDHVQDRFLAAPEKLAHKDEEAVTALFEALVYSGCAMTLQGSSLPASGGEHLISHALDMRADAEGGEHDLHGRQVGVSTIFAAALYERVLSRGDSGFSAVRLPLDRAGWGSIADEVAAHHEKQTRRLAEAAGRLADGDTFARVREAIAPMLPRPGWLKHVLQSAGAAHRVEDLGIGRERYLWAVANAAQIRERFTSLDLAWAAGVLPDAAEAIVDEFLVS